MDYVAYYRVSTKKQSKSGLGLEAQQHMVRTFASQRGRLVHEVVEVESGRKDQRSELAKAMSFAKRAGASLLIARLDRFSRRVSFIATMMEKGVPLTVVEMPNASDFQLHIFAALAQEERRLISERTKAALHQAKRRGTILGANGRTLALENRLGAQRYARELEPLLPRNWTSMSLSGVARHLNASGIHPRKGERFYPQTVKNVLRTLELMTSDLGRV